MGLKHNIAIIGAGAAGCICAYFLLKAKFEVSIFDFASPLRTLLPTGGGRCNLAHAEYDFKELAKNYPRGEKFLYSVFSKFSTYDTLNLFNELGIDTYVQDDNRIFPTSNSAKDVREKILNNIKSAEFVKEKVEELIPIDNGFKIRTNKADYFFSDVIISSGGKSYINGTKHKIIPFVPSLVGLNTQEKAPSGIILKNVYSNEIKTEGDILFTHFGISGPLTYKISSIKAGDKFPYSLTFDLYRDLPNLQELLNLNPHKDIKNILSNYLPQNFVKYFLGDLSNLKAHNINGKIRDSILEKLHNFKLTVIGTNLGEETVSAGGFELSEINPKTMESKIHPHLYFAGEALNIDGFCGGFNLQNAWSTAFVATEHIISQAE